MDFGPVLCVVVLCVGGNKLPPTHIKNWLCAYVDFVNKTHILTAWTEQH